MDVTVFCHGCGKKCEDVMVAQSIEPRGVKAKWSGLAHHDCTRGTDNDNRMIICFQSLTRNKTQLIMISGADMAR